MGSLLYGKGAKNPAKSWGMCSATAKQIKRFGSVLLKKGLPRVAKRDCGVRKDTSTHQPRNRLEILALAVEWSIQHYINS